MKKLSLYLGAALLCLSGISCTKDHKNDGGKSQAFVNMTTYDYLKTNPKFDSLVRIIDHAGLKDAVNSSKTFFASTNYAAVPYVTAKRVKYIANNGGNENINFGITLIDPSEIRDSMRMYMFDQEITRENLTLDGNYYQSLLTQPDTVRTYIHLDRQYPYNNYLDYVDYIYFSKIIGLRDRDRPAGSPQQPSHQNDIEIFCQTTGIITTTGVLHVLSDNHVLMFNGENKGG